MDSELKNVESKLVSVMNRLVKAQNEKIMKLDAYGYLKDWLSSEKMMAGLFGAKLNDIRYVRRMVFG